MTHFKLLKSFSVDFMANFEQSVENLSESLSHGHFER